MTIKQTGGIFGRSPTFADVEITGQLQADSGQFDGNVNIDGTVTADGLTVSTSSAVTASFSRDGSDGDAVQIFNGAVGTTKSLGLGVSGTHGTINSQYGGVYIQPAGTTSAFFGTGGDISFYEDTGTTPKFFWDASAESLGIGTSSPSEALTVSGAAAFSRFSINSNAIDTASTAQSFARFNNTGGDFYLGIEGVTGGAFFPGSTAYGAVLYNANATPLSFYTNATERMRLDASGNLLVGTTTAYSVSKTTIDYSSNGAFGITLRDTGTATDGAMAYFVKGGAVVGSIISTTSATSYNTSSDYRLKEDVQPMTGASDRVLSLNPVNFAWKADGTRTDGFLAHEAQAVAPYAVTGEKDGEEMQSIDHSKLVPLLTAALQEALTEIAALKDRVAALEA